MEKLKKFEFPPLKIANKIFTEEKEKYQEIFTHLFPKIKDNNLKEYKLRY
jgi:hypothetical protein